HQQADTRTDEQERPAQRIHGTASRLAQEQIRAEALVNNGHSLQVSEFPQVDHHHKRTQRDYDGEHYSENWCHVFHKLLRVFWAICLFDAPVSRQVTSHYCTFLLPEALAFPCILAQNSH